MRLARRLLLVSSIACLAANTASARFADEAIRGLIDEVDALFVAENFDALDQMADAMRAENAVFPGGIAKLGFVYNALSGWSYYDVYWFGTNLFGVPEADVDARRERLERWLDTRPESQTARLTLARLWQYHAWQARTGAFSKNVTKEKWQIFRYRNDRAAEVMEDATFDEPEAYVQLLQLARDQNVPRDRIRAIYDRAVQQFPLHYALYIRMTNMLEPRWGGQPGELLRYAESLHTPQRGDIGKIAYGFVAIQLLSREPPMGTLFKSSGLRWEVVREGFLLREARQGLSSVDWNVLFYFACDALDRATARLAANRIGQAAELSLWLDRASFEQSVSWAGG